MNEWQKIMSRCLKPQMRKTSYCQWSCQMVKWYDFRLLWIHETMTSKTSVGEGFLYCLLLLLHKVICFKGHVMSYVKFPWRKSDLALLVLFFYFLQSLLAAVSSLQILLVNLQCFWHGIGPTYQKVLKIEV